MRKSTMTHPGSSAERWARNSRADVYVLVESPPGAQEARQCHDKGFVVIDDMHRRSDHLHFPRSIELHPSDNVVAVLFVDVRRSI